MTDCWVDKENYLVIVSQMEKVFATLWLSQDEPPHWTWKLICICKICTVQIFVPLCDVISFPFPHKKHLQHRKYFEGHILWNGNVLLYPVNELEGLTKISGKAFAGRCKQRAKYTVLQRPRRVQIEQLNHSRAALTSHRISEVSECR